MPINESEITSIEASIKALLATDDALMPGLRSLFPSITFVRCSASEMDALPFRTRDKYQLFLFDRSQGCIRLTDQLDLADGVIVAEVEQAVTQTQENHHAG